MALFLAIIAIAIIVSAINNTYADLGAHLKSDLTGTGNFIYWLGALIIIGLIGYVPYFRKPVYMLLTLIILVFVLKNGTGFFAQLQTALKQGPQAPPASTTNVTAPAQGIPVNVTGLTEGNSGGVGSKIASAIPIIGGLFE